MTSWRCPDCGTRWAGGTICAVCATKMPVPSVTCPRCGLTSYHPKDAEEGYCARCHDWTQQGRGER